MKKRVTLNTFVVLMTALLLFSGVRGAAGARTVTAASAGALFSLSDTVKVENNICGIAPRAPTLQPYNLTHALPAKADPLANYGLSLEDFMDLRGNPFSEGSEQFPKMYIPPLDSREAEVLYDAPTVEASGVVWPEKEWSRTFGGPGAERASSVQQTADGGFILAGWTESFGAGGADFWLVKTDAEGNKQWDRTFGGPRGERASSVQQTADGGFIIAGHTRSFGAGGADIWLVKTDAEGNKQWDRTFGGPRLDLARSVQQTADGGFIIAGLTKSFGAGDWDIWLVKTDAQGNKEWDRTFGGPERDEARSVQQTADGGFIIAGATRSTMPGYSDIWLVKTDAEGNKQWDRTFGGPRPDLARSVQQTADGGFIIAGLTKSFGAGDWDIWLVKTDAQGNKEWDRTFGGPERDVANSVQQTADAGFIIAGETCSFGAGGTDFWLVKTDAEGNKQWIRTFGGPERDVANSVQQTADGGFIIAGVTESFGGGWRDRDFWLIRVAPVTVVPDLGAVFAVILDYNVSPRNIIVGESLAIGFTFTNTGERAHTFGAEATLRRDGDDATRINFLVPVTLAPGESETVQWTHTVDTAGKWQVAFSVWEESSHPLDNLIAQTGWVDEYISATTVGPKREWDRTFGGPKSDGAWSVQQTANGGFILAGWTESFGAGGADFWLVKTDAEGNKQWDRTFGGPRGERASSVQQTADGGFIIAGHTRSFATGGCDFWLVKTDAEGNKQWSRTFGGPDAEWASSVQQTDDGGFILAGWTDSFGVGWGDFWLVKTDAEGNKEWDRTFGSVGGEAAYWVQQTADGGFIIAGSRSPMPGCGQIWLVKTDAEGNKQWHRILCWPRTSSGNWVQQTADGGFIIAGSTLSSATGWDFWLVKTDDEGNKQWERTFGGPYPDRLSSVQKTADGGFILAGQTHSFGAGGQDFWLVKTDAEGNKQWDRTFGGPYCDSARSVQQTADGGFIIAGVTESFGAGQDDFWLIKVAPVTVVPDPGAVSAVILDYNVSSRNIIVGESLAIGFTFTFTNTGEKAHTFGAEATLRRDGDDATRINFLAPVTLAPGKSETVQWSHAVNTAGKWQVAFSVWEESSHPLDNLIAQTGWVDQYITVPAVLDEVVTIPDPNLEAAIREALGIAPGVGIYQSNLKQMSTLHASDGGISDLTGLEYAVELRTLYLSNNQIANISPLVQNEGLADGDRVILRGNPLSPESLEVYLPHLAARGVAVYYYHDVRILGRILATILGMLRTILGIIFMGVSP